MKFRSPLPSLLVLLPAFAALVLSMAPAARADAVQDKTAVRTRVEEMLADTKDVPTCDDWKALPPVAVDLLIERAKTDMMGPLLRTRAVYGLGCFGDAKVGKALEELLQDSKTPALVRRPALRSYAQSQQGKALPEIKKALEAKDPQERFAGVESAAVIKDKAVRALLKKHMETEQVPVLQERIKKILESQ